VGDFTDDEQAGPAESFEYKWFGSTNFVNELQAVKNGVFDGVDALVTEDFFGKWGEWIDLQGHVEVVRLWDTLRQSFTAFIDAFPPEPVEFQATDALALELTVLTGTAPAVLRHEEQAPSSAPTTALFSSKTFRLEVTARVDHVQNALGNKIRFEFAALPEEDEGSVAVTVNTLTNGRLDVVVGVGTKDIGGGGTTSAGAVKAALEAKNDVAQAFWIGPVEGDFTEADHAEGFLAGGGGKTFNLSQLASFLNHWTRLANWNVDVEYSVHVDRFKDAPAVRRLRATCSTGNGFSFQVCPARPLRAGISNGWSRLGVACGPLAGVTFLHPVEPIPFLEVGAFDGGLESGCETFFNDKWGIIWPWPQDLDNADPQWVEEVFGDKEPFQAAEFDTNGQQNPGVFREIFDYDGGHWPNVFVEQAIGGDNGAD